MSPVFPARRAEEFAAAVDDAARPGDPRHADLLELVGALRATPAVEPRAAFVADLRERLMTAAATELVSSPGTAAVQDRLTLTRRTPRERRLAVAVGGFAIVGATTSMAVAAQSALPGDVLYPLKRAIENAHTGLSVDDEQKGATLLANASGRLEEVDRLTRAADDVEDLDVRAIEDTLDTFTAQATEASDLMLAAYAANGDDTAISELQDFTAQSFASLNQLAAGASDEIRDALVPVGNALTAIEAAVQQACPTCPDVLTSIPPWMLTSAEGLTSGLGDLLTTPPVTTAGDAAGSTTDQGGSGQGKGTGKGRTSSETGQGQSDGSDPVTPVTPVTPPVDTPLVTLPGGSGGGGGKDGSSGGKGSGSNPVEDLVGGLLGGGSTTTDQQTPEVPIVGDVLDGVGEVVGGITPVEP
jgi:hypothetical protein